MKPSAEIGMEDRMDEGLPLSLPLWGSSQVTLCESVRLYVAGKRSFDGCGFRSGCPVVSAHGCDTVNHAVITHARRCLHRHNTHTHAHTDLHMQLEEFLCMCTFLSCQRETDIFFVTWLCCIIKKKSLAEIRKAVSYVFTSWKAHRNYDCTTGND